MLSANAHTIEVIKITGDANFQKKISIKIPTLGLAFLVINAALVVLLIFSLSSFLLLSPQPAGHGYFFELQ